LGGYYKIHSLSYLICSGFLIRVRRYPNGQEAQRVKRTEEPGMDLLEQLLNTKQRHDMDDTHFIQLWEYQFCCYANILAVCAADIV
jgi:hypothetical protein